ncbi:DNA polymerase III subunit chi [Aestuariibacter sp. AA17]|uniref:DNA polymerase III subunit chi n=1 Tax=Fluctibacter corallii TaxID=2984329 RepID=A0ABT3A711_9ALTE|nr:DNA polymerase III subunit chi [Aestuariibacter sp. AA17]MCV2884470.1 DNA polymerase III subunit chi [Aestuariibacter sp. AA17]
MPRVIFYLLDESHIEQQPAQQHMACVLATQAYRQKRKAVILCENKNMAENVDELLWQRPVDAFVPHNLSGEGPGNGTPVEITWQSPNAMNRSVLINLGAHIPGELRGFSTIYDFVPVNDDEKQQARERYKQYRAAGCQLDTLPAKTVLESTDG